MSLAKAPDLTTLYRALDGVERPLMREHSVKAFEGEMRVGRVLISLHREQLGPGPSRVLRGLCARLGAPDAGVAALDMVQSRADSVHFGFEPEPWGTVLKCYLEFTPRTAPQEGLVFLALKWWGDGRWTISEYRSRTDLPHDARANLIAEILPDGPVFEVFSGYACHPDQPTLLEVTEPGTPRRSLDVTLADRDTTLGAEHDALLCAMGQTDKARRFLTDHTNAPLGHLAGGTARDGRAFATVYYGAHHVEGAL